MIFWAENIKILHYLLVLMTNTSLSGLNISAKLLPFHWVVIYNMHVLP